MDLKELKAKAYDLMANIEQAQLMLRDVNQQIAVKFKEEREEKKEKE